MQTKTPPLPHGKPFILDTYHHKIPARMAQLYKAFNYFYLVLRTLFHGNLKGYRHANRSKKTQRKMVFATLSLQIAEKKNANPGYALA